MEKNIDKKELLSSVAKGHINSILIHLNKFNSINSITDIENIADVFENGAKQFRKFAQELRKESGVTQDTDKVSAIAVNKFSRHNKVAMGK